MNMSMNQPNPKIIPVSEPENEKFRAWLSTLPESQQAEWHRVNNLHLQMVQKAMDHGDAVLIKDEQGPKEISWISEEIHTKYLEQMSEEDRMTYQSFWKRFKDPAQ